MIKNAAAEYRLLKSLEDDGEVQVLQDEELETLWDKVDSTNTYDAQRWNILILGFRTGLRGECLKRLQVGSFEVSVPNHDLYTCNHEKPPGPGAA